MSLEVFKKEKASFCPQTQFTFSISARPSISGLMDIWSLSKKAPRSIPSTRETSYSVSQKVSGAPYPPHPQKD